MESFALCSCGLDPQGPPKGSCIEELWCGLTVKCPSQTEYLVSSLCCYFRGCGTFEIWNLTSGSRSWWAFEGKIRFWSWAGLSISWSITT